MPYLIPYHQSEEQYASQQAQLAEDRGLYQIAIEGEKQKIKVGIKKKGQATKIYSKKQRNQKPSPVSVLMGT